MDEIPAKILEKAGDSPVMLAIIAVIGGIFAIPKIRSYFAIEGASEGLRKELGDMLASERVKVDDLSGKLDGARVEIAGLRREQAETHMAMSSLRVELRTFTRLHKSMRRAMQRAVDSGDTSALKIWLDLNPDEEPAPSPNPV